MERDVGYIEGFPTCRERDVGYIEGFPTCRERDVGHIEGFPRCREHDVGHIGGIPTCRERDVGHIEGILTCRERDVGHIEGFPTCRERDVGYMDAQIRDKARSSPAVGLLRALWTHFASAPFSAPVADFRGVTMPLTAKQLRPLRVRVRAVSGVWGLWR
jgi:hypothetical protein